MEIAVKSGATGTIVGDESAPMYDLIELFFFAYRDFVGDADRLLETYGFGRAHHRVLHFVSRQPGLTIAELLDILKITKQSLNRVLKELIAENFIEARAGAIDRRHRQLFTTPKGSKLARDLALPALDPDSDRVMVCGSPAMLADTAALLEGRGFRASPQIGEPGDYVIERAFGCWNKPMPLPHTATRQAIPDGLVSAGRNASSKKPLASIMRPQAAMMPAGSLSASRPASGAISAAVAGQGVISSPVVTAVMPITF